MILDNLPMYPWRSTLKDSVYPSQSCTPLSFLLGVSSPSSHFNTTSTSPSHLNRRRPFHSRLVSLPTAFLESCYHSTCPSHLIWFFLTKDTKSNSRYIRRSSAFFFFFYPPAPILTNRSLFSSEYLPF